MKLEIFQMSMTVVGNTITLVPTPGVSEAKPTYLALTSVVLTSATNPAPPDEWKPSTAGKRYKLIVESES